MGTRQILRLCILLSLNNIGTGRDAATFRDNYRITKRLLNTPNDIVNPTDCPRRNFMVSFRVQYTEKGIAGFFYKCAPDTNFKDISDEKGYSAATGGKYAGEYSTENGVIIGFDFQTKEYGENGYSLTNLKAFTTDPEDPTLPTKTGLKGGKYTGIPRKCLKRQAVCGMQLQDNINSKGQLTLIEFNCCPLTDPARVCKGKDHWGLIRSCDHTSAKDPKGPNIACSRKVTTGVTMSKHSSSSSLQGAGQTVAAGFSAGYELAGVTATMEASLGDESTTGAGFTEDNSQVFTDSSTITVSSEIMPGFASRIEQAIGTCGDFNLKANVYRRLDRKGKDGKFPQRFSKVRSHDLKRQNVTEEIFYMRVDRGINGTTIRQDIGCFT